MTDFLKKVRVNKRIVRLTLGWILLVLGLLGLVLPILQGILFLSIAVVLLAPDIPFFKRVLQALKKRYPRATRKADKIVEKTEDKLS